MGLQATVQSTMRVKVYSFRVYSVAEDIWVVPHSKRTADDIDKIGGQIVADSGELIEQHQFDQYGRFYPSDASTKVGEQKM